MAMLGGTTSKDLFLLVSVPKGDTSVTLLPEKTKDVAMFFTFDIPPLLVGTQDSLMMLSDELAKVEAFADSVTRRVAQQLQDLLNAKPELTVHGTNPETYLTNFKWEEAKYSPKAPLRDTVTRIQQQVQKLDEELRNRAMSYNNLARDLEAEKRKEGASLLTRNLAEDIKPEDFIETEYLTTLFVVVPKQLYKEWKSSYEFLTDFVLPRSSKQLKDESDFGLFTVTLFKRVAEDFKNLARENKFTVREFMPEQLSEKFKVARTQKINECGNQQRKLTRWCKANFAEAFLVLVHLKVIRTFVESVLRYGLPANFYTCLLKPKKDEKRVTQTLCKLFEHLADKRMLARTKEEEQAGDKEDFLPLVLSVFDLDMSRQAS